MPFHDSPPVHPYRSLQGSFIGLLVQTGIQVLLGVVYDAARLDDAGWWRRVGCITLSWVKPTLLVAALVRMVDVLRLVDLHQPPTPERCQTLPRASLKKLLFSAKK